MSDDLSNPHDSFFRGAFALPEVSNPFFQRYLPPGVLVKFDLDTLKLEPGSFIDERLREQRSDLLFSVSTPPGSPALVYLLLEHKSYQDRWTAFQVLSYVVRILTRHARGDDPFPPILTMVLYHGQRAWSAPTTVEGLTDAPSDLAALVPHYGFQLCDLSQTDLENLQHRAWLAMALQVLKFIRDDELSERLPEIMALFQELYGRWDQKLAFLEMIVRYLAAAAGQLDEDTLRGALRKALPRHVEEKIMPTIAETWEARGEIRGEKRGKTQGELERARHILQRQLKQRFGPLPADIIQRIDTADLDTLDTYLDRVLVANSLDGVFQPG